MTVSLSLTHLTGAFCAGSVGFLLAGGAVACGHDSSNGSAIVLDSAGIVIVESRTPEWPENGGWRVADVPLLAIGSADGPPEYQFHLIEGALRLEDGRVAVADGGSGKIRFFDETGHFLNASGGTGDAPGEYRMLSALGSGPGDSLWVFDYGNRRFTVLSRDGEPQRTVSLGGFLSAAGAVGRLPDGSFVVKEGWGRATDGVTRTGLTRDPVAVAVFAPDGSSSDTLGLFPGREVFVSNEDGRAVMNAPIFAHNTSATIRGDEVFVGIQETLEIGSYSRDGTLERLWRVQNADLQLSADDIATRKQEVLSTLPSERRAQARDQLDAMDVPSSRPAYGRLLVDADGSLWAAEQTRYPTTPRMWQVFSPDGRLLGAVVMPERFRLFQVGIDWVLGVGLDEVDVEYVQLYRLEK